MTTKESLCHDLRDMKMNEWTEFAQTLRSQGANGCDLLYDDDEGKNHACRVGLEEATTHGTIAGTCNEILGDR